MDAGFAQGWLGRPALLRPGTDGQVRSVMDEQYLDAAEVARALGVSPDTVTRWCRQGRIEAVKPGRDWRIPRSALASLGRRHQGTSRALNRILADVPTGSHVLVLALDGQEGFRAALERAGPPGTATLPAAPPARTTPLAGALTRAAARALAARALALAAGDDGWLVRAAGDVGTEERLGRLAGGGVTTFCLLPEAPSAALPFLLGNHTHLLAGSPAGACRLQSVGA